jgi:hypothetical protein
VQKKQPGILATSGVPDPQRPGVSRPWRELVADLLPTVAQEAAVMRAGGRMLSEEERLLRKKMFVLLTIPKDESLEGNANTFLFLMWMILNEALAQWNMSKPSLFMSWVTIVRKTVK